MTDGFCECGCGGRTSLAPQTNSRHGYVKGRPIRFINGHNGNSPETRMRIAEANRGRKPSPETRAKMSAALRGSRHHNRKGGRCKDPGGYIHVLIPPEHRFAEMRTSYGYVLEHRLVIAGHLDRPLTRKEVVHHLNGEHDDNRFENLQLFENQAAHLSHHGITPHLPKEKT